MKARYQGSVVDDSLYDKSIEEIAAEIGVSKQRVSAIIDRALWKLKRSSVLREFAEPSTPTPHHGRGAR